MNPQDQPPASPQTPQQPSPQSPDSTDSSNSQPNQPAQGTQPQIVYMSRPHEPLKPEMSPASRQRHEESKRKYPDLNLSEGEFIISAIDRHPIGLIGIWFSVGAIILALVALAAILSSTASSSSLEGGTAPSLELLAIPVVLISLLALIFGFIATIIYNANKFFLTNESVIQQIQTSLFSKREQTVSLANIEDASYTQDGVMTHLFHYGMIRLSTEGDETTYRFNYASNPKRQIAVLNNAVEAFKNGRPVTGDD
ncbi:MAG TPA: hypothetical protein VF575_04140 [Candidatus Saccharimonadales bacterium]|jgi:hypothetical protein